MRKALQRVVKRIMIIKRLTIIRQVNDVIEKVCKIHEVRSEETQTDEESNDISFKKLVKIMNLCHVYIPLV